MNSFLSGHELYGDNLSPEDIKKWFDEEKEAYAELGSKEYKSYIYHYDNLNIIHGFSKLPAGLKFDKIMGFGAAYGQEFKPLKGMVNEIHIIEPSDQLVTSDIFGLTPIYTKPSLQGKINYPDNYFDVITCFGTLHHIPNVSFVFSELSRVLKPGGYLLTREPIISMGDWTQKRQGLTRHERGIPINFFRKIIKDSHLKIVSESLCFCMTAFILRKVGKYFPKPIYSYKLFLYIDKFMSWLFSWNVSYHHTSMLKRVAATSVFYVLKK